MKIAHFYAYGIIGQSVTAQKLTEFLQSLSSSKQEILIHIDSPGGNVYEAFAMRDLLKAQSLPVNTIVEGKCYSAAPLLMLCGEQRTVTNDSILMLHAPFLTPGPEATFTGDELMSAGSVVKAIENKMAMTIVNATGGDETQIKDLMRVETFITPQQALELKLATAIAEPVKAMAFLDNNSKNENSEMKNLKELFAPLNAKIDELMGKLNIKSEAAPVVEPVTPTEPAPAEPVASTEPTLEEQLAAIKAENETLKQQLADKEKEATEVLAEINAKYETLAKSIRSDFTVPSGQTDLSRTPKPGQPANRVEEARRIRAEKAAQMKTVK